MDSDIVYLFVSCIKQIRVVSVVFVVRPRLLLVMRRVRHRKVINEHVVETGRSRQREGLFLTSLLLPTFHRLLLHTIVFRIASKIRSRFSSPKP